MSVRPVGRNPLLRNLLGLRARGGSTPPPDTTPLRHSPRSGLALAHPSSVAPTHRVGRLFRFQSLTPTPSPSRRSPEGSAQARPSGAAFRARDPSGTFLDDNPGRACLNPADISSSLHWSLVPFAGSSRHAAQLIGTLEEGKSKIGGASPVGLKLKDQDGRIVTSAFPTALQITRNSLLLELINSGNPLLSIPISASPTFLHTRSSQRTFESADALAVICSKVLSSLLLSFSSNDWISPIIA